MSASRAHDRGFPPHSSVTGEVLRRRRHHLPPERRPGEEDVVEGIFQEQDGDLGSTEHAGDLRRVEHRGDQLLDERADAGRLLRRLTSAQFPAATAAMSGPITRPKG